MDRPEALPRRRERGGDRRELVLTDLLLRLRQKLSMRRFRAPRSRRSRGRVPEPPKDRQLDGYNRLLERLGDIRFEQLYESIPTDR